MSYMPKKSRAPVAYVSDAVLYLLSECKRDMKMAAKMGNWASL